MNMQEELSAARHFVSFPRISNARTKVCFFFFCTGIYFPTVANAKSGRLHNALRTPVTLARGLERPFADRVPQHGVASAQRVLPCVRSKRVVNTLCCYIYGRMFVSHIDVHYFLTKERVLILLVFF